MADMNSFQNIDKLVIDLKHDLCNLSRNYLHLSASGYKSLIKIDAKSILPPVIDPEIRKACKSALNKAIDIEKKVESTRTSLFLDKIHLIIQKLETNDTKLHNSNKFAENSFDLPDNCKEEDFEAILDKIMNNKQNYSNLPDKNLKNNINNKNSNKHKQASPEDFDTNLSNMIRSNSYILDKPSPQLIAQMENNNKLFEHNNSTNQCTYNKSISPISTEESLELHQQYQAHDKSLECESGVLSENFGTEGSSLVGKMEHLAKYLNGLNTTAPSDCEPYAIKTTPNCNLNGNAKTFSSDDFCNSSSQVQGDSFYMESASNYNYSPQKCDTQSSPIGDVKTTKSSNIPNSTLNGSFGAKSPDSNATRLYESLRDSAIVPALRNRHNSFRLRSKSKSTLNGQSSPYSRNGKHLASLNPDKLAGIVKGFLTRRLLKTTKVQHLKTTIKDTLECLFQIKVEREESKFSNMADLSTSFSLHMDLDLEQRLTAQLACALDEIHEIFFEITTSQRLKIIEQDRSMLISKRQKLEEEERKKMAIKRQLLEVASYNNQANSNSHWSSSSMQGSSLLSSNGKSPYSHQGNSTNSTFKNASFRRCNTLPRKYKIPSSPLEKVSGPARLRKNICQYVI